MSTGPPSRNRTSHPFQGPLIRRVNSTSFTHGGNIFKLYRCSVLGKMAVALSIAAALLLGTLTGWLGHWALHQKWSGRFYKAHLTHHRLYPPSDFQSATYRDAKGDNTVFFLAPIITFVSLLELAVLVWLQTGWPVYVTLVVTGVLVGYLHDYAHEAFHLEGDTRLNRFVWFKSLRKAHWVHHRSVKKNLGILWFGWDRLFKTYSKLE